MGTLLIKARSASVSTTARPGSIPILDTVSINLVSRRQLKQVDRFTHQRRHHGEGQTALSRPLSLQDQLIKDAKRQLTARLRAIHAAARYTLSGVLRCFRNSCGFLLGPSSYRIDVELVPFKQVAGLDFDAATETERPVESMSLRDLPRCSEARSLLSDEQ